jgi:hypothetical protein
VTTSAETDGREYRTGVAVAQAVAVIVAKSAKADRAAVVIVCMVVILLKRSRGVRQEYALGSAFRS